ncbi:MAG TPA: energy-coupling factor transporter ATPase [Roseiflexaceae bacterium]|nr:energy-coupling factor transporter ATPase [Roseiflexaceae bacterium]
MLEAFELSFAYNAGRPDAIQALRGVDLRVAPGELVAVIGHNGSGKSTLARLLAGVLLPTGGRIAVDGVPCDAEHIWDIRRRVGMVFQQPDDQLIANTVIDDVAFGPENLGLPRAEIERRVERVLGALGLADLAGAQISELSGGQKQRVAIAGVLAMQPDYLILDEPTTMIAPRRARQVLALARELRDTLGLAVIHITHFMREVVDFDRLVVMDSGSVLVEGPPREVFGRAAQLRAVGLDVPLATEVGAQLRARGLTLPEVLLTPAELADALPPPTAQALSSADKSALTDTSVPADNSKLNTQNSTLLIEARGLRFTYLADTPLAQEALRGVDCALYEGETLAILGGSQAGKSTLIEFFNALRVPPRGQLFFEGEDIAAPGFDIQRVRERVGMVFQQPESQLLEDTVGKDISYAPRRRGLPPEESRALVRQALADVGLDYEAFRLRYIHALSGGQKRRVALAGVLAARPAVLILDEPVAGLDPRGRAELAALIADLTRRLGQTVVLVGSAVDDLAELADRALVLHEGRVVMEGPPRALLRRAAELHDLGLELGGLAEIALALRARLPDLPTDLLHIDELVEAILRRVER